MPEEIKIKPVIVEDDGINKIKPVVVKNDGINKIKPVVVEDDGVNKVKKKSSVSRSPWEAIIPSVESSVKEEQQPSVSSSVKKAELPKEVDLVEVSQQIKQNKTKDGLYTFPEQDAIYKKSNGQWFVDVDKSGNFQPLTKGNVEERTKNLDFNAIPLSSTQGPGYEERISYLAKEKAKEKLPDTATEEEFNKEVSKNELIEKQKRLKELGYDVEPNGDANDKKTIDAFNKYSQYVAFKKDSDIKRGAFMQKVDKTIDLNLINQDEDSAIKYLRDNFGKDGFIFKEERTGYSEGDAITVQYSIDGMDYSDPISIDLQTWMSNPEELNKLKSFIKNKYVSGAEKDVILNQSKNKLGEAEDNDAYEKRYYKETIKLLAQSPDKFGEKLIDENQYNNYIDSQYEELKSTRNYIKEAEKNIMKQSADFKLNPTKEKEIAINNSINELNVLRNQVKKSTEDLVSMEKNYYKALGHWSEAKEKQGNFFGSLAASLVSGVTSGEKALMNLATDALVYTMPNAGMSKSEYDRLIDDGYTDSEIKSKASSEIKRTIVKDVSEGITNIASLGSTTDEYIKSKDRSFLENVVTGLAESVGAAASGGGNKTMQGLAFFSQSYNSMQDQLSGKEFDEMSVWEKGALSATYGLVIGQLENLGFDKAINISKNSLVDQLVKNTIAKTIPTLPKKASTQAIEEAISKNLKKNMIESGLRIVGGGLSEGTTEGLESITDTAFKNVVNAIHDKELFKDVPDLTTKEGIKEALGAAMQDAAAGAVGGMIMSSYDNFMTKRDKTKQDSRFELMRQSLMDSKTLESVKMNAKMKLEKGKISKEQYDKEIEGINNTISTIEKIPDNYTVREKREAFELINKKQSIEKSIEGKDPLLVTKEKKQIADIDAQLVALSEAERVKEEPIDVIADLREDFDTELEKNGISPEMVEMNNELNNDKNATKEGNITESNITERENGNESGKTAETSGSDSTIESGENQKEVEKLRADERAELAEAIPNIEDYKVDGKIDKEKIKASEYGAKYQEIYDKYDKLITPLLPKKKITVFRGVGNNVMDSDNSSTLWVAEDEEVAKNYAGTSDDGKLNVESLDVEKPSNPIEMPYKLATDVRGSNIADNLRSVAADLTKSGKLKGENISKALGLISDFESKAGENLELFTTKMNKPEASEAFSKAIQALGFDGILQEESASREGVKSNTYGILKTKYPVLLETSTKAKEQPKAKTEEQPIDQPTTLEEAKSLDKTKKEETLKYIEDVEKELKELEYLLEKIEQKKKEKIKEKIIDKSIKESLSNNEIEDAAKEQGVTVDELIKIIKENIFKPIANLGSYIKEKTKELIKKTRQKLLTIVFGGAMLTSTLGFSFDNNGKLIYNIEQLVDSILPDSQAQQVKRWLDKNNYLENQDIEITNKKESTIKEAPQVEKSFEVIGAIPDSYNPSDSLLSYRSQWDNSKGFEYIPAPVKKDLPSGGMKVSGVIGVGHFLLDASAAGKTYSHEYNKKFLERAKQLNHWIPTFTRIKNGRVLLKYKKFNEINKKDIVLSPLRQFSFSNIDFSKTQTPSGFKNSVKEVKTKDGKGTYLLFKSRDGYSRFSGGSVVFIFKDSYGNTIVRDFAGSLNQIENEGVNIKKAFNLKDGDLIIGYHDVGSFSAKPKAKEGVIDTEQWDGFNNEGMTGGALLIPIDGNTSSKTPTESGGGLLALLALVKSLKRKLESDEELSDSEILDIKNKIKTLKEEIEKNKQKESEASKAAKDISKKDNTKVTVNERTALKDQLRLEAKAARESAMNIKKKQRALADSIKAMAKAGKITASQSANLLRRLSYLNVDNEATTQEFLDYAERLFANAEYSDKVDKGFKAKAKIKAKLKSKNQAQVTAIAKEFSTIDPSLVTDIDKYNEMADAMLAAIAPSVSGVKKNEEDEYEANNKLKTPIVIADVQDYVDKALEAQKEIERQRLLSYYNELVEAGILNDKMSIEEIREVVANENNDDDKLSAKEREKIVRDDLNERFEVAKSAIEDIIDTDDSISKDDREVLKKMMSLDLNDMSIKDAMSLIDSANNFIVNGITAGLKNDVAGQIGNLNAKKKKQEGVIAKSIGLLRGFGTSMKNIGSVYATQILHPNMLANTLFGSKGPEMMRAIGYDKLSSGVTKATIQAKKILNDYQKKFIKTKPNGVRFKTTLNRYERGMYASLIRNVIGTDAERKATFKRNLDEIFHSTEKLLNSGDATKVRKGKVYQELINKLGLADKDVSIESVKAKVDPINVDAVNYMIDVWNDFYNDLYDLSLSIYNTQLDKEDNYTPRRKSKLDLGLKEGDLLEGTGSFSEFLNLRNADKDKSGVLKEANKSLSGKNRYQDFDFDGNNKDGLEAALMDIYTAEAIREIEGFIKSEHFKSIIPVADTRSRFERKLTRYINIKKGRREIQDQDASNAERLFTLVSKFVTGRTLGTISAAPAQFIAPALNTLINTGRLDFNDAMNQDAKDWMDREGVSVRMRGTENFDSINRHNEKRIRDAWEKSGIDAALSASEKWFDFWLKNFLVKSDKAIAVVSWFSYYKKSLKEQGLSTDIDWKNHQKNDKAFAYANSMIDKNQNASDSESLGNLYSTSNPVIRVMRNGWMPYSSFIMNQKARMHEDAVNMFDADEKKINIDSMRSLFAGAAEMIAFHAVQKSIKLFLLYGIANLILDDEDEEALKKMVKDIKDDIVSSILTDAFSPAPIANKYVLDGANYLIGKSTEKELTDDVLQKEYEKDKESRILKGKDKISFEQFKKDYIANEIDKNTFYNPDNNGFGGIYEGGSKMVNQMIDLYNLAYNKKVSIKKPDGTYIEKYVDDNVSKAGKIAFFMTLAHDAGVLPGEASTISRMVLKKAKAQSVNKNIKQLAADFKKELGLKELAAYQKDMIKSGTSLDTMIKKEYEIALVGGLKTAQKQESFKKIVDALGSNFDVQEVILQINSGKSSKEIINKLKDRLLNENKIEEKVSEINNKVKNIEKKIMIETIKNSRK